MFAGAERPAGNARPGGAVLLHGGSEGGFGNPAEVSSAVRAPHPRSDPVLHAVRSGPGRRAGQLH